MSEVMSAKFGLRLSLAWPDKFCQIQLLFCAVRSVAGPKKQGRIGNQMISMIMDWRRYRVSWLEIRLLMQAKGYKWWKAKN